MVYEDMHWSDPTTRESLDLLIDRVPTLRVLAIVTFRPEFAPPMWPCSLSIGCHPGDARR